MQEETLKSKKILLAAFSHRPQGYSSTILSVQFFFRTLESRWMSFTVVLDGGYEMERKVSRLPKLVNAADS